MQTIRLQNLTPEVYPAESRDFQLLCRVSDATYNGVKADIDSIVDILNTQKIKSNMLPLLQTKLGFFTKTSSFTDSELRYILDVFPYVVKNKGSLKALKILINMILKLNNSTANYNISVVNEQTVINDINFKDHSIVVELQTLLRNTELLQELAKYALPSGFELFVYYTKSFDVMTTKLPIVQYGDILISSSNINARIRGSYEEFDGLANTHLGAVDTTWLNTIDSKVSETFLGTFSSVSAFPATATTGSTAIDRSTYNTYYYDTAWRKLSYKGAFDVLPDFSKYNVYDVISLVSDQTYVLHFGSTEVNGNYRGIYNSVSAVTSPKTNDIINLSSAPLTYYRYYGGKWTQVNYLGTYLNVEQIDSSSYSSSGTDLAIIKGMTNFIKLSGAEGWNSYTNPLYIYNYDKLE